MEKRGNIKRVAIREGFFSDFSGELKDVRLIGSGCKSCGARMFGRRETCERCGRDVLEDIVFSKKGKIYTYTIARYRPLPPYVGPDPHIPFPVAWVELPEGVRILSKITDSDIDAINIGMDVELVISKLYVDEAGNDVITYSFKPPRR